MRKRSKKKQSAIISDWAKQAKITINPELNKYDHQEPSPFEKEKMRKGAEMLKAPGLPKEFYK